jgi:hypothetical protein
MHTGISIYNTYVVLTVQQTKQKDTPKCPQALALSQQEAEPKQEARPKQALPSSKTPPKKSSLATLARTALS